MTKVLRQVFTSTSLALALLAPALASLGGCHRSALVPPEAFRAVRAQLGESIALQTIGDGKLALGPRSLVRARLRTGEVTPWFTAAFLLVSPEGLIREPAARLSEVQKAWAEGLAPDQMKRLRALAPPGALVIQQSPRVVFVTARSPETFRAWVSAFAQQEPPTDRRTVMWTFQVPPRRLLGFGGYVAPLDVRLPGRALATAAAGATIAPGIRWREVQAIEVESLAPTRSALLLPLTLGLGGLALRGPTEGDASSLGLIWQKPPERRLFSPTSSRRSTVRFVTSATALAARRGDLQAGLGLGIRVADFLELLYLARRTHSPAGAPAAGDGISHGGGLGFHIDGDGDRRFAFQVALEINALPGGPLATMFRWGPRLGLPWQSFVSLHPLTIQSAWIAATADRPGSQWTVLLHGIELGFAF